MEVSMANNLIAGGGFALMAWELAQRRCGRIWRAKGIVPRKRKHAMNMPHRSDAEYYRILDRAYELFRDRHRYSSPVGL